jgi:hypothetical protein
MGQVGWVSVLRKIPFPLCSLKAATQCNFGRRPPRSYFLPNGGISARKRALNHQASCRNPRIIRHPGRAEGYFFDDIPHLRRCQSFAEIGDRPIHVSVENFSKELLLVAKGSVKTRPIDAHGLSQIGEGSTFVALGPKNMHGAFECDVSVERAGSSERCWSSV